LVLGYACNTVSDAGRVFGAELDGRVSDAVEDERKVKKMGDKELYWRNSKKREGGSPSQRGKPRQATTR
jgi:hypothetical protein